MQISITNIKKEESCL